MVIGPGCKWSAAAIVMFPSTTVGFDVPLPPPAADAVAGGPSPAAAADEGADPAAGCAVPAEAPGADPDAAAEPGAPPPGDGDELAVDTEGPGADWPAEQPATASAARTAHAVAVLTLL
jgi:hypothetical protein